MKKRNFNLFLAAAAALLLFACVLVPAEPGVPEEITKVPSETRAPDTPAPSATAVPPSPTPAGPVLISPDNAGGLVPLASLEVGEVYGAWFDRGGRFVSVLTEGRTTVIELAAGLPAVAFEGDAFSRVAVSPDGLVAAGLQDGTVQVAAGPVESPEPLVSHPEGVTSLAFTPDGRFLFSAGLDGFLQVTPLDGGASAPEPIDLVANFGGDSQIGGIDFSPDGSRAALFLVNQSALWVGSTESVLAGRPEGNSIPWVDHAGPVASVLIDPDWEHLAWISRGTLQLMTIDGERIGEAIHHEDWVIHTAFLPELGVFLAATVVTGEGDVQGVLRGYSLASGETVFSLSAPEAMSAMDVSPDGRRAAAGHYDGVARVWDLESGAELFVVETGENPVQTLSYSPDGALLLVVDGDNEMRLYDAGDGTERFVESFPEEVQIWAAFSAGGNYVAVITTAGDVVLYGIE